MYQRCLLEVKLNKFIIANYYIHYGQLKTRTERAAAY